MSSLTPLHLAQASIGAIWIGIPAHCVVQAITLPAAPAMLPRRAGALAGVVGHEGRLLPVLDLARWVDVGVAPADRAGAAAPARVLILHAAGRTIGLKVDSVDGLAEVAPQDITRLHHDARKDEVFHCVVRESANQRILSLLDVERLARLAEVWHQDSPNAPVPATAATALAVTRPYALVQAGAARLALAADALTEVLPMPALATFGAGSGMAYCTWRGRHLPVLAHAALGLDPMADGTVPGLLAVIEHAGLALGLPVHAALNLQAFETTAPATQESLLSTVFEADGAPLRVLDEAHLFARFGEAALSRDVDAGHGAAPGARGAQAERAANATAYIVFEGDGMYAAAIDTVERIVSLRDVATDGNGAMAWQGRTIALRDLRATAGASGGDVMVVRRQDEQVGYVVARVHLLVPPGSGRIYRMGTAGTAGAGWEFIATGEGAAQASYRIVDLGALAA